MKLTYGWTRRQYSDARANVTNVSDSGDVTVRAEENQGYERSEHYTALDAMGDVEIAGQRHQLVIGADYETTRDYLDERYFGDSVTVSTVTDVNHGQLAQVTPVRRHQHLAQQSSRRVRPSGSYVSDRWYLSDKWILGLGGRYTWFDQQSGQGEDFVADLITAMTCSCPPRTCCIASTMPAPRTSATANPLCPTAATATVARASTLSSARAMRSVTSVSGIRVWRRPWRSTRSARKTWR